MSCLKRILQLKEAIQYQSIRLFDEQQEITTLCLYSWSIDGICWTSWANHEMYDMICKNIESDYYLRVLINGSFKSISLNDVYTNCYSICLDTSNIFLREFCEESNLFQPYNNLDCALQLQEQLSDSIVCMFGIPIYYIQINPNEDSADYTFKEYSLHKVQSIKQLKLMIPDGTMPSSNPKLTEFDFEWEIDWDTELSKTQFAKAFGDTAYPKSGDCIYIPMMKRMWEVNAAYDEKNEGLLWRSTTWKIALVKYSDSTNVDVNMFGDLIDNWTQTYEDVFDTYETNEQERQSGFSQINVQEYAPTNLYDIFMEDAIRKQYTKHDVIINEKQYNQRGTIIGRNIYKFKNPTGMITYQKPICGDSGMISFILETQGNTLDKTYKLLEFGNINIELEQAGKDKYNIIFNNMKQEIGCFSSYIICIKWNKATFNSELCIYPYTHKEGIPLYRLKPELYWFDFENPTCEQVSAYNNDYNIRKEMICKLHAYPCWITNIKYYNRYLDKEEGIKEMLKYITQHESCIINDVAKPIEMNHGYTVR